MIPWRTKSTRKKNGIHARGIDKVGSGGSFVVIDNELFIAAGGAGAWNREYSHGSISQMGKRSDKFEFDNRDARSAGQRNPYPILFLYPRL